MSETQWAELAEESLADAGYWKGQCRQLQQDAADLREALERAAKWMDFVAAKLADHDELDRNIRKYGARKWVFQFGQGAGYRAEEARAAIAKSSGPPHSPE